MMPFTRSSTLRFTFDVAFYVLSNIFIYNLIYVTLKRCIFYAVIFALCFLTLCFYPVNFTL